jgi:hypothetical protein
VLEAFSKLPVEDQLLLTCARTEFNSEEITRIQSLASRPVDWDLLLELAHRNGIQPLLYLGVQQAAPDKVPPLVMKRLKSFYLKNAGHNLFLAGELSRLLALFESRNIKTIPYKGPAMTVAAYGNLAYRQFGDLDLIVSRQDALRSKKMLMEEGYLPIYDLTPSQERNYLHFESSFDFTRENVLVDLHWEIAPRSFQSRIDISELWGRLVPVRINGKAMQTVSPEDLLLILCVDASRELWERLARVCDIAQLLGSHPSMKWQELFRRAEKIGCRRMVVAGCCVASAALSVPLPPEVERQIQQESDIAQLAGQMVMRLIQRREEEVPLLQDSRFQPLYVKMRERSRDKLGYFLGLFFIPHLADWKVISLPGYLFFIYYLIRPIRLAGKFGKRIFHRYFNARR